GRAQRLKGGRHRVVDGSGRKGSSSSEKAVNRFEKEGKVKVRALSTRWKLIPFALLAVVAAAVAAGVATATPKAASTIKIAVLSDCQGAFGSFDNQDLAGVVTAMSQFAGGKAVNPNKPRSGWTGASIAGHPLQLVGIGCGNAKPDVAIKETKRQTE